MRPIGLVLTDTHLKENNHELVKEIFKQAIKICKKLKTDNIFHAGDFFTNRVGQSLQTLLCALDIADMLIKEDISMYIIPGNHDKTSQDSENSYIDIFRRRREIQILRKETVIDFEGVTVGFLPFFTDSYANRLNEVKDAAKGVGNRVNILITHQAFDGVRNNDGTVVEDANSPKSVKFWTKVLVGHYHDASVIGKNIYYIGSTYQANYGENFLDKGFTILYDDGSLGFEPSKFPKYVRIKLELTDNIDSEIEMHASKNDNVRFIFSGDKTDIHKIDRQKLDEHGIDVKFELNEVNEEILKVETGNFSSMSRKNIFSYFKEYCDIQGIDKEKMLIGIKHLIK